MKKLTLLIAGLIFAVQLASATTTVNYGSGPSPILTTIDSLLHFAFTDPTVQLNAGVYVIRARVNVAEIAATYSNIQTLTLHLRRTNNSPADIPNSDSMVYLPQGVSLTSTAGVVQLPEVIYATSNTNDVVGIYGRVSAISSTGEVVAVEASIAAEQIK